MYPIQLPKGAKPPWIPEPEIKKPGPAPLIGEFTPMYPFATTQGGLAPLDPGAGNKKTRLPSQEAGLSNLFFYGSGSTLVLDSG
jgi:hypothetical protein